MSKLSSNEPKGILDDLFDESSQQSPISHLAHIHSQSEINRSKDASGHRLSPYNFRLTNQPVRAARLTQLLNGFQSRTAKQVTLGKLMSAIVDNKETIFANDELVEKLIESMRDM